MPKLTQLVNDRRSASKLSVISGRAVGYTRVQGRFDWIDFHDADNSVVSFLRKSQGGSVVVFVVNATSVVRYNYRLGVPESGFYREVINTDGETYGGSNVGNFGGIQSEAKEWMGREHSILIHLPPLATVALRLEK